MRIADLAMQIGPPFLRAGDFETSDGMPAGLAIELERLIDSNGLMREIGHHLRPVCLEDEAGGVRGRAPGGEERSGIDHHDFGFTELTQVIRRTASDNARADDRD